MDINSLPEELLHQLDGCTGIEDAYEVAGANGYSREAVDAILYDLGTSAAEADAFFAEGNEVDDLMCGACKYSSVEEFFEEDPDQHHACLHCSHWGRKEPIAKYQRSSNEYAIDYLCPRCNRISIYVYNTSTHEDYFVYH